MDAGLLVEPIVMRLPFVARVHKADAEGPHDLRDQLVDLAQRDLQNTLAYMRKAEAQQASTCVLANTGAWPGTELDHSLVHPHGVTLDPAVRVEGLGVGAKDIFVVLYNGTVDADAVAFGEVKARDSRSAGWNEPRHNEPNARVQTHTLVDARLQKRKFDRFCIGNGYRERAISHSRVYLGGQLIVGGPVAH